jgi:excisionase family DNA binding protein
VVNEVRVSKKESRSASEMLSESAAFTKSGRQDLNLRPLGPEGRKALFHGVAGGGTGSQAVEEIEGGATSDSHGVAQIPSSVTRHGAPVVRSNRAQVGGELLTVNQAAERLSLCRATIYRLCKDGNLACIRILNAVRIPAEELERFVAGRKNAS